MPWKESRIMDQRLQFLASYQKEEMSVADLCRAYGISRPTAYRWINRYNETGPEGLVDRSRRPHTLAHGRLRFGLIWHGSGWKLIRFGHD
jgi:transposase